MTWAFYAYACGTAPAVPLLLGYLGVPALLVFQIGLATYILSTSVASTAFLVFAARFPDDAATGWRRKADSAAPYIFIALVIATLVSNYEYFVADSPSAVPVFLALTSAFIGLYILGFAALVTTYFGSAGSARQRTSWVIAGLAVSAVVLGAQALDVVTHFWPSTAVGVDALSLFNVAVPLTVAYAVLRHNILDIRFVISRALVYGVMTSLLVVVFALIDWIFVKQLENTGLGIVAEVGAAVGLGFWLNSLHHHVDQFVDSVFFRQRYLMEKRLARVAGALPHAVTADFVDETLVAEPHNALQLASCAVFRRIDDGQYVRTKSLGWSDDDCRTLDLNDPMLLQLVAGQVPLDLHDLRWPRTDLPDGAARPVLAVPVLVRRQLIDFALYGSRAVGEALDPDEVKSLNALASGASVAFDHIEAEELRRKVDAVVRENQALRTAIAADNGGHGL